MILIDKDMWDKESSGVLLNVVEGYRRKSIKRDGKVFPKIYIIVNTITPYELALKSLSHVDDVLVKPLRLSSLISCFQVSIGSCKKQQANRKTKSNLGHLLKGKKILVVDDNVVNRKVAEGALKKYGASVTCVDSGKKALNMLKPPHEFDACFMDLQMPEMDGFEATKQIRWLEKEVNEKMASGELTAEMFNNVTYWHTPVLAMTADVIQASNEKCMKCGMDDYVSKPFEEEQLYNAVAPFFESS